MSYQELIVKALHGRSVNKAAQEMGIPQPTLNRYARGERLPEYSMALLLAKEAGMDLKEVFLMLAHEDAKRKGLEIISKGFESLLALVKPRGHWVSAWC
ncbi:helix-turn-helix domain-containing protein [Cupriavidus basilensis]